MKNKDFQKFLKQYSENAEITFSKGYYEDEDIYMTICNSDNDFVTANISENNFTPIRYIERASKFISIENLKL